MHLNTFPPGRFSMPQPAQWMSASAFLTMALALLPHSSYAWGAAIMVIVAFVTAPKWLRQPYLPKGSWALAFVIGLMGLVWLYGSDFSKGASAFNKPSRYFFALPCLFCLLRYPPSRQWLLNGIICGAALGGMYALYTTWGMGHGRPWVMPGRSANAIQLGDLSGFFGLICWLQITVYWKRWSRLRVAVVLLCAALGVLGSLLSQSRGGWLALALSTPILLWLIARCVSVTRAVGCAILLLVAMIPAGLFFGETVVQRVDLAMQEAQAYHDAGRVGTSIGQRLELWRVAWDMALEKPVTGWGLVGYTQEKERRVKAKEAAPQILKFGHSHQELLDQFVKRGLIGIVGLLLLYSVPLTLFWPRRQSLRRLSGAEREDVVCLRLIGVSVPLAFAGFGLTQVFFAHYNGVILYLVLVMFLFAALHRVSPAPAAFVQAG